MQPSSSRLRMQGSKAGIFQGIGLAFSAATGRDISAQGKCGGVSRQTPPWVRRRRDTSPERATHAVVDQRFPPWTRHDCFVLSGLPIHASRYPGRRFACPGLVCCRPFGAEGCASFRGMNQKHPVGLATTPAYQLTQREFASSMSQTVISKPGRVSRSGSTTRGTWRERKKYDP